MSPKRKPKPKKRPNPKQVFAVQQVTRAEIADAVNGVIENEGWDVPKFAHDDPRLTDKFCKDYCDGLDSGISDVDEVVDRQYQYEKACVAAECGIELEDEEEA